MTHKHFIYHFAAEFQLMSDSLIIDGVFITLLVILKLSIAGQTFFNKFPFDHKPTISLFSSSTKLKVNLIKDINVNEVGGPIVAEFQNENTSLLKLQRVHTSQL